MSSSFTAARVGSGPSPAGFLGNAINAGDEMLLVLAGETELTVLEGGAPVSRVMGVGGLVVVPQGCWHDNDAPSGVTMLYATPTEGNEQSWDNPIWEGPPEAST
jgi:hypothetical protein